MTANRDDRLDGKVVLVTGAGSRAEGIGNGRAAAILLARAGAKVPSSTPCPLGPRGRRA